MRNFVFYLFLLTITLVEDAIAASPIANVSASSLSPTSPTPGFPAHYDLEAISRIPENAQVPGGFEAAILNGTPWIEERYRYEDDSQDGITRHAKASTLRSRVGYETGAFENFKTGFELQNVESIGAKHYNSGINGKALYPTVTDPEETAVRQAYISYDGIYKTEIKAGRQLINLDNQRFVGQSDWRQFGNNFDAVSLNTIYFRNADIFYAYVRQANRGYTDSSPLGTLIGNTHLINASYVFVPELKVTGYSYLLDFESSNPSIDILSTATYGVRLTGQNKTNDVLTLSYSLEAAKQRNYADNPLHADNNYYLIEPAANAYGLTGKLGYEMMQGDGTASFQTPINSNHSFDGWADKL